MLGRRVRRPRARHHRGEPPGPHPRQPADGALEQVRLARAHDRQQVGERRSATRRSTATSAGGFAVIKDVPKTLVYRLVDYRNARDDEHPVPRVDHRPRRRAPSCAPTSATRTRCPTTTRSTRSSRPTSRRTLDREQLVRAGLRPGERRPRHRAGRPRRVQAPPGAAGHQDHAARVRPRPADADHERLPAGPPPAGCSLTPANVNCGIKGVGSGGGSRLSPMRERLCTHPRIARPRRPRTDTRFPTQRS